MGDLIQNMDEIIALFIVSMSCGQKTKKIGEKKAPEEPCHLEGPGVDGPPFWIGPLTTFTKVKGTWLKHNTHMCVVYSSQVDPSGLI